jgi:iron complex outermembrane receptor protein
VVATLLYNKRGMTKNLVFLIVLVAPVIGMAQRQTYSDFSRDTVRLPEVSVSANLPLANQNIVDFYRTNHFATIDNINARLEGMSLIKRGAYAQEPMLHGFSGGQLNVTIDGMKIFGACTDRMDPVTSYIEPTNLKTISIRQGTSCNESGCNVGGSVDMSLQEPIKGGRTAPFASVGFGYESVSNGKNILFSSGTGKGRWAWGIDGVYRRNENYRDGNNKTIPFTQFEKINLHSVGKYDVDKTSSFKLDVLYDLARNVGYPALPMDVSKAEAALVGLEYRHEGKVPLKAKLYFNRVVHLMDDSERDSTFFLTNTQTGGTEIVYMRMDMPGRSTTLGTYIQAEKFWNRKNRLSLKLDNYTNNSLAEMTMYMNRPATGREKPMYMQTWPEMLRNVSGIFVQNTTFISEKLRFVLDARLDYGIDILQSEYGQQQFSVFGYSLNKQQDKLVKSMNLSSTYNFNKHLTAEAALGYAERLPTITERLGFYLYNAYDGYDYIGNPYIKPERSNFARVAFRYSGSAIKLNLSQSFSRVDNYIMGISDRTIEPMNFYTNGTRVYANVPWANLYSADLDLMVFPAKNWSVFMLGKYTYGELHSGDPLPLMPPLKTIVSVRYSNDRFSVQLENESSLPQTRINLNYGESKSKAYSVFHVKSSYAMKFWNTKADVGLGVSNLLNKAYYDHLDWGRINRPGRSVELFLKLTI